jgi:site-specific DNA recombinase
MLKDHNYNIALYIRVSTEEQASNEEGSLKSQEQRLRAAVEFRNRQSNFGQIVGVYNDAGISAKDMNRPRLQDMLRDIRQKKINLVMVTEITRLSRSNRDFLEMWDMMHDLGCRFMSLGNDFDTTTAAGEMLLFQMMNFAQFERKQTSERVSANILARASRGLYNGGSIPLGFKKCHSKNGSLDIDEPQAETVRIAFDAFLREGSLSRTARWLNDNGHKAKIHLEGGGSRMRIGHFTVDNLQKMLRNKAYIGIKTYSNKGEIKEAKAVWDAIVDEVVFLRVNEMLTKNKSRLKPITIHSKHPYLLSGVAFCMTCGDHMPGKSATGRNGKVPYYEHSWATKRESCLTKKTFKCEPTRVQAKKAEALVWAEFCKLLDSKEFLLGLQNKVRELHSQNNEESERGKLKAKQYGINSQLEALAERIAILPREVSPVPLFKQMEKLEVAKKDIEERLLKVKDFNLSERLVTIETFEHFAQIASKTLKENPDFNIRRSLLQKFIYRVEIGVESVKIYWNLDQEFFERELKIKKPSARDDGFLKTHTFFSSNSGSQSLTNGAQDWT